MIAPVVRTRSIRARRRAREAIRRRQRQPMPRRAPEADITRYIEADGDFEAEVSSLREPARTSKWASGRHATPRRWHGAQLGADALSRGERLRRAVFVCVLLGLALLGATGGGPALLALLSGTQVAAGAPMLQTLAQSGGIVCLRDAAWSPDSRYLAFIGNGQGCNPDHFVPAMIDLYAARTRQLLRQIDPDAPVLAALRSAAGPQPSASGYRPGVISYQSLLWSPNGTRFALTFVAVASWDPAQHPFDGVELMNSDGSQPHVLLRRETADTPASLYLQWDLRSGGAVVVRQLPITWPLPFTAEPALAYAWQDQGGERETLAPVGALAGVTPSLLGDLTPVGNQSGGARLSIWQPGWLELDWESGDGDIHAAGLYTWRTAFSAWSPDGRYLVSQVSTAAQIEPLGFQGSGRRLVNGTLSQLPLLPVRDAGLEHMLEGLIDTPRGDAPPTPWLAWRLDGRVLAAQDPAGVAFYDCATGRLLAVRSLSTARIALSGELNAPRWSPDGTMLVLPNGALLSVGALGV